MARVRGAATREGGAATEAESHRATTSPISAYTDAICVEAVSVASATSAASAGTFAGKMQISWMAGFQMAWPSTAAILENSFG